MKATSVLCAIVVICSLLGAGQCATYGQGSSSNDTDTTIFKPVLQAIGKALLAIQAIAEANADADVKSPISGFFLDISLTATSVISELINVNAGKGLAKTGADCLTLIRKTNFVIKQYVEHANDPIFGSGENGELTSEDNAQQALENAGLAIIAISTTARANANATNPGKYLTIILEGQKAIDRVQTVVDKHDSSPECFAAAKAIGFREFQAIQSASDLI